MGGPTLGGSLTGPAPVVPGSIGVMGGTFDPIHIGHLAAAEEAREALGLELVLFVPAGLPPHKADETVTSASHRLAMVELAIAGHAAFASSRIEVDRSGPSWTADTIERLAASERAAGREPDLTLILSAETFRGLPGWHEPDRLLAACRIAVVPRASIDVPGEAWLAEHLPAAAARIVRLEGPRLDLSSTQIRRRAAAGRSLRYLVPDAVAAYIGDHGLYRDEPWSER